MRTASRWILLALLSLQTSCSSSDAAPGPLALFGALEDPLTGTVAPEDYAATLPAEFLVGSAAESQVLLDARADAVRTQAASGAVFVTVVDASMLSALEQRDLTDALLTPATLDGGSLLLDLLGGTAASLRGAEAGACRVQVDAAGRIVARSRLGSSGR